MNCTNEELLSMIISVANGCGITSESNELMLLRDEALARMNTAQQSVQPTLLESGQKFAPESVNPYPCDTN